MAKKTSKPGVTRKSKTWDDLAVRMTDLKKELDTPRTTTREDIDQVIRELPDALTEEVTAKEQKEQGDYVERLYIENNYDIQDLAAATNLLMISSSAELGSDGYTRTAERWKTLKLEMGVIRIMLAMLSRNQEWQAEDLKQYRAGVDIVIEAQKKLSTNQELQRQLKKTQRELAKIKKITGLIRQPAALINGITKNPESKLNLFSGLDSSLLAEVEAYNNRNGIIQTGGDMQINGLDTLTAYELKIVLAISILLGKSSQNTEPDKPDFYLGNSDTGQIAGKTLAGLGFNLRELAREVNGGKSPGGNDISEMDTNLREFMKKMFPIPFTEIEKFNVKGVAKTQIIKYTLFQPLIWVVTAEKLVIADGKKKPERHTKDTKVWLNQLFTHEIATRYLNTPVDIIARTSAAYGSTRVPWAVMTLRDRLRSWQSTGKKNGYTQSWYASNLHVLLYPEEIKQRKKGRMLKQIKMNFETQVKLGILECYPTEEKGATGEIKYIFTMAKNWPNFD